MSITKNLEQIKRTLPEDVVLVAISKTKSNEEILQAYHAGQRIFGENKVQEMTQKWEDLPKDIQWHMVGHVQRNKVKYMAEFVSLVHAVDSLKLLKEINKQAKKHQRSINCLLQIKIAEEDTKYGITIDEVENILTSEAYQEMKHVRITGLMGMATLTEDTNKIKSEFQRLHDVYHKLRDEHRFSTLSMGMSGDYELAIEGGSNMVRVGSAIFGERNYH